MTYCFKIAFIHSTVVIPIVIYFKKSSHGTLQIKSTTLSMIITIAVITVADIYMVFVLFKALIHDRVKNKKVLDEIF